MNGAKPRPRLGEILVSSRVITNEQLESALEVQAESHRPLGAILIDMKVAEPYEVAQAVARQVGLLAVDLDKFKIDSMALSLVPPETCSEHEVLPLQVHGDMVLVAMAHPANDQAYAAVREAIAPKRVRCVVANESQIQSMLHDIQAPEMQAAAV